MEPRLTKKTKVRDKCQSLLMQTCEIREGMSDYPGNGLDLPEPQVLHQFMGTINPIIKAELLSQVKVPHRKRH